MLKFFIVGEKGINKEEIIDLLEMNNNSEELFKVAKIFTTDLEEAEQKYWYYIDNEDLSICYKNNAILFIKTVINKSYGITLESFYESNILFMDTEDFNNISNKIFLGNDEIVLIWLDTKNHDKTDIKKEINETNYLIEKIESSNINYLYFLDGDKIEIMDVIAEYMLHEDKRAELIEKYS